MQALTLLNHGVANNGAKNEAMAGANDGANHAHVVGQVMGQLLWDNRQIMGQPSCVMGQESP